VWGSISRSFDWGSDYFIRHGRMMPDDGLDQLEKFDAILLGAVGDPRVPDDVTLWGLLLPIPTAISPVRQSATDSTSRRRPHAAGPSATR